MIGPHEGQELDLMLAGRKHLAVFHDLMPQSGTIPEEIIPEQAFAPYIHSGRIIRLEKTFKNKSGNDVLYVCFTPAGEEWRAKIFFWIKEQVYSGHPFANNADDILIGRLLGYSDEDVREFLDRQKTFSINSA